MDKFKLTELELAGFKSFDSQGQSIEFGDVTVLLGANASGKSNLVSFFQMLNYMTTGALQKFVGEHGYADSLLHLGAKRTPRLEARLKFEGANARDEYRLALTQVAGDTLMFTDEAIMYQSNPLAEPHKLQLGAGHRESRLYEDAQQGGKTSQFVHDLLRSCQVFQFHDTSPSAKIRGQGYIDDNKFLRSNGGNLAAFLYAMKSGPLGSSYYERIVRHIQAVVPGFEDFVLEPSLLNKNYILLNWREQGEDYLFGPHQLSDGSLRFMALATLLLQPPELPKVILLDEPELGLHPSAIASLAGMVRTASRHSQLILATQSPRLVDEFDASQIVVVERADRRSVVRRLGQEELADWLERYSLSELWEKNVLGGRP